MKPTTFLPLLACLSLASCISNPSPSGFLEDYDELQPGNNPYAAKLSYTNPDTDFSKYDSIMFEPLVFILPDDSKLTEDDKKRLVKAMSDALNEELRQDYKFVSSPGPTTMLMRGALTELVPANRPGNVVTSVVPLSRVVSEGQQLTTGMSTFSARGTGELEIRDSVTNERLAAVADTRYARKKATTSATRWGEIEAAMVRSAKDLRSGLEKLRNR
ncbi:MAG: DUF3313 domain-containing protein [Verrucomicrobiota bacterium]